MTIGSLTKCVENENEVQVHWKIEDFLSLLKSTLDGGSPYFVWSDISWGLSIYCASKNVIQLFLSKYSSEKQLPVLFKLGIRLIDGTSEVRSILHYNFECSSKSFGTHNFMLKTELLERKRELLSAGSLTLTCSVAHLDTLTNPQNVKYECLDVLSSNFKSLYDCSNSSDVTIVIGSHKYPVHKAVLIARSDVFAAMFRNNMEEVNSGIIKVVDCDPTSFNDFLLYLYTGKVENLSSSNVCNLYRTADKYNLQELMDLCVRYMKRHVSSTNWCDIAILANQFNEAELLSLTQDVFQRNVIEIMKAEDWEQFVKENFTLANQLVISMIQKVQVEN